MSNSRFTVFPIQYPSLWSYYQKHLSTFWTVNEINLTDDINDWNNKLNDNERFFIKNILAFFASSDGIVNENLVQNFYTEIEIPEVRQFYAVQIMIEAVHGEQYSLLIDTYVNNAEEKNKLFNAIDTIPAVRKKAEWAIKWMSDSNSLIKTIPSETMEAVRKAQLLGIKDLDFFTKERPSLSQRLLAFVCVEGIFFSGSFCAIYWLKSQGKMPGLATANEFISRDENLHASFAILLYKTICTRLDEEIVHSIFKEAVEIEEEFITESLPVSLLGMNSTLMKEYIKFVADRWLVLLDYNKIYNVENPFGFMEMLSLNTKTNFFENVVSEYSRAGVGHDPSENLVSFDDEDF